MLRSLSFIVVFLFLVISAGAQSIQDTASQVTTVTDTTISRADSLAMADTLAPIPTAVSKKPFGQDSSWQTVAGISLQQQALQHHPYYRFDVRPVAVNSGLKIFHGKEILFYTLVAMLLLFAFLRIGFAKYFTDLFRVFFRTTMKQRQIREQLMQTPLPSLLYNLFFVLSTGLYIVLLLQYYEFRMADNFWLLYLYCCAGLFVTYSVKFIGLKICGWLFNMKQATDSYIFIVFIINKVIGIFLLPFLVLLSFSTDPVFPVALVLSWCGLGGLLLYRFILGFAVVRNEVKLNLFHFFLYLCAFELAPLLLIYKVLLLFYN